jgi:hypothetical protein
MVFAVLTPFFKSNAEVEGYADWMSEADYDALCLKAQEYLALDINEMSRGEQFLVESQLHFLHHAMMLYNVRTMNDMYDCFD